MFCKLRRRVSVDEARTVLLSCAKFETSVNTCGHARALEAVARSGKLRAACCARFVTLAAVCCSDFRDTGAGSQARAYFLRRYAVPRIRGKAIAADAKGSKCSESCARAVKNELVRPWLPEAVGIYAAACAGRVRTVLDRAIECWKSSFFVFMAMECEW